MSKLKLGELFAGYGGLGMAVEEVFDAELAWYAEFDDAPSKIMAHHWPGVPNHRDVTTVDWSQVQPVDIISGGSPCQDLSAAGRRAGMTEGTRSNLWVSMREAIATIKPTYVVWENVRGAYSAKATSEVEHCPGCMGSHGGDGEPVLRALGRVLGDLSDLGYDAEWRGLRVADVGGPHSRYRVFLLATRRGATEDANSIRSERRDDAPRPLQGREQNATPRLADGGTSEPWTVAKNSDSSASGEWRESASGQTEGGRARSDTSRRSGAPTAETKWGPFASAIARWEASRGTSPAPVEPAPRGGVRLAATFAEWMMGLEPGHVTGVPDLTRNEQLKAIGNGVVPQQAIAALKNMLEANNDTH